MVTKTQAPIRVAPALEGAFPLNADSIWTVLPNPSMGVYVLSRDGTRAHFVGRADDLRARLLDHAGLDGYSYFWFAPASSAKEAFRLHCFLFHQYGEGMLLDNWRHVERPEPSDWRCPGCDFYP